MPAPTGTEDTPMPAHTTGATGRGTLRLSLSLRPRLTPRPSPGGTATTAHGEATGDTPAHTGTGTPTAHTTTGADGAATGATGRGTLRPSPRLSLRPTPIPRHGTPAITAGGGADGATDTGPTAMELTATAGGGNLLASSYSPKLHLFHANSFPLRAIFFKYPHGNFSFVVR